MLHVEGITKVFDGLTAVDSIDFQVGQGEIYGFLGPNGAGKTTTIRMIMGIIEPDAGNITFGDQPIRSHPINTFGYLPEERGLYQKQKLRETISYFGILKGMSDSESKTKAEQWIHRFGLQDYSNKKIQELSKGNQQKVQFILTLLHHPKLVVLDEPFTGLDPVNQLLLKEIILEQQAAGVTFLFSTHQMEQVERLCTNICLINKGSILLEGKLKNIRQDFQTNVVTIEFDGHLSEKDVEKYLSGAIISDGKVKGTLAVNPREFINWMNSTVSIKDYSRRPPTLEEIFIQTVGGKL